MKTTSIITVSALALSVTMTSCANRFAPTATYKENQIGVTQTAHTGIVQSVEMVKIEGNNANTGTTLGAIAGGLGASTWGGGKARFLTGAGGALVGAFAGNQIDKAISEKTGQRITVKLDDSKTPITIIQVADKRYPIQVGQRVQVYSGGNSSRVVPLGY